MTNPAPISDATPPTLKRLGENFCPGILHAVPAKDGLLMRLRVPGGLIHPSQLRTVAAVAAAYGDGTLEITSRANLQVRALQPADLAQITETIAAAGLLPSPLHDRVRNLVSSPIAGLDPHEILDPRPFLHQLDRKLRANPLFAQLHPKFSFGIFGSPTRFSPDADDLALEALDQTSFRLTVAGAAFLVPASEAVDRLLQAATACIAIAHELGVPVRARKIVPIPGVLARIAPNLPATSLPIAAVDTLLGISPASKHGLLNMIPSVPLGRLTSAQAFRLADMADFWLADLRLAPWRGIVFGAVPQEYAETIAVQLASIGLSCAGDNGFRGIAACAGITGCDAALTDVRAHAIALATSLAGRPAPAGWSVNLSGCDKQCARRHGATADLIAYPSGYTLKIQGQLAAVNLTSATALESVLHLHSGAPSQTVPSFEVGSHTPTPPGAPSQTVPSFEVGSPTPIPPGVPSQTVPSFEVGSPTLGVVQ